MSNLKSLKAGDEVAVLVREGYGAGRDWKPNRLSTVQKVTTKQVFLSGDYVFSIEYGSGVRRMSRGSRISADPATITELRAKREQVAAERVERERRREEMESRKTWQLAVRIQNARLDEGHDHDAHIRHGPRDALIVHLYADLRFKRAILISNHEEMHVTSLAGRHRSCDGDRCG